MHYIVGLGNPGEKYIHTRHNIGRDILRVLADKEGMGEWEKSKGANALYLRGSIADESVELLLPETYMNKSGQSVRYMVKKHEVWPEELILIYDDVDLPLGEVKISEGKGSGGHNGITSVINAIKTKDFIRIRIGIAGKSFWTGKPVRPSGPAMSKHVLGKFSGREQRELDAVYERAYGALTSILTDGVKKAMNQFN